jgi:hypothetical protein
MRSRFFIILSTLCFLISCHEEKDPGSVENPVKELPWLVDRIQELENSELGQYFYFTQAKYGNETVFILGNCCPMCDSNIPVYNCSGEQIGIVYGDIPETILDNDILIWKSTNSTCTISY